MNVQNAEGPCRAMTLKVPFLQRSYVITFSGEKHIEFAEYCICLISECLLGARLPFDNRLCCFQFSFLQKHMLPRRWLQIYLQSSSRRRRFSNYFKPFVACF